MLTLSVILLSSSITLLENICVLASTSEEKEKKRTDENKYAGYDKANQTAGSQNFFPHAKGSGEKILKGIWLVLGLFLGIICLVR